MLRHVKVAEMTSMYNQLTIVWNNIDVKFRRDIFESTVVISLFSFLNQLNSKISIWFELTRNQRSDNLSRFNKIVDQYTFSRQQDSTFRYSRDQFDRQSYQSYQSNQNQYQHYSSNRFANVYQSRSASTSTLFFARQSLQITNENASDSQNQNNQRQNDVRQQIDNYNVRRNDKSEDDSNNRDDYNINNWRNRSFAYQVEEQHDEQEKKRIDYNSSSMKNEFEQSNNYFVDDLNYYNSNHQNQSNNEIDSYEFFTTSQLKYLCRRCKSIFLSNNQLHKHIRAECQSFKFIDISISTSYHDESIDVSDFDSIIIIKSSIVESSIKNNVRQEYDFRQ